MLILEVVNQAFMSAWAFYTNTFTVGLVQTAMLLGAVAAVSLFSKKAMMYDTNSWNLGIVLGCAGLLTTGLSKAWVYADGPVSIYLSYDALFISAIFGGWKSALAAFSLTLGSRVIFGAQANLHIAAIDMALSTLVAYAIGKTLRPEILQLARIRDIFILALCRSVAMSVGPLLFELTNAMPQLSAFDMILRRFFNSMSISLIVIGLLTKLFRREMFRNQELYMDPLCHLPNRRALQRDLEAQETEGFSNNTNPVEATLLIIKLENIRDLIQSHGYAWADLFLQKTGTILARLQMETLWKQLQARTYIFTEGVFVLKLHGINADEAIIANLGHRVYKELSIGDSTQKYTLPPTFSVGIVDAKLPNNSKAERFLRALSLYERPFTAPIYTIEANFVNTIQLESKIRIRIEQWIANGTAEVYLQPKMNLHNDVCIGAESLLRMHNSRNKDSYVNPHQILSVAVKYHLLEDLEWAIIKKVIQTIKSFPPELKHLQISVNISPVSLAKANFGKALCTMLEEEKVPPHQLIIEVIETSQLPNSETVKENINFLHHNGVLLSLDDYGTGYASISLLSRYHFDELKIDYSMVSSMQDPRVYAAIQLSAETANRYGADLVAEGIETETQREELLRLGIKKGQGFLFSRAVPCQDFVTYARHRLVSTRQESLEALAALESMPSAVVN